MRASARIETGPADLVGRIVFVALSASDGVQPAGGRRRPAARRTCRPPVPCSAANMETALNAVWDAAPGPADRIAVVGGGVVGALVRMAVRALPGAEVTLVDIDPQRAEIAAALGVGFSLPPDARRRLRSRGPCERDPVRASRPRCGSPATRRRCIEMSWYGAAEVAVPLGGAFHSRRLQAGLEPGRPGRAVAPAALDASPPARRRARLAARSTRSTRCSRPPSTSTTCRPRLPKILDARQRRALCQLRYPAA